MIYLGKDPISISGYEANKFVKDLLFETTFDEDVTEAIIDFSNLSDYDCGVLQLDITFNKNDWLYVGTQYYEGSKSHHQYTSIVIPNYNNTRFSLSGVQVLDRVITTTEPSIKGYVSSSLMLEGSTIKLYGLRGVF